MLEREFHRSFRGPDPSDEDTWLLTFDAKGQGLRVRHSWRTIRHSGGEDVTLEEVLAQPGAARDALLGLLFDPTATEPPVRLDRSAFW